jgi:hypothetical protein
MINEIIAKIINTEDCRILDEGEIQKIESIKSYKNVIEVTTEVSLQSGNKEVVLYIGIPNPPLTLPKMFIKNESYESIKFIPHINKDLNICIYDEGMNHVFNESYFPEIVEEMIYRAKRIIAQGEELETISDEFEREFKAYWEISYDKNDIVKEYKISDYKYIENTQIPKDLNLNFHPPEPISIYSIKNNKPPVTARYVRIEGGQYFAIAEVEIIDMSGNNILKPHLFTVKEEKDNYDILKDYKKKAKLLNYDPNLPDFYTYENMYKDNIIITLEKEEKHYSRFYRNKKNSIVKS